MAVKGCMKRSKTDPTFSRNPNFKETINILIALGADSTIEDSNQKTAKQMAQLKLIEYNQCKLLIIYINRKMKSPSN